MNRAVEQSGRHLRLMWAWGCVEHMAASLLGGPLAGGGRWNTVVAVRCLVQPWTADLVSRLKHVDSNRLGTNTPELYISLQDVGGFVRITGLWCCSSWRDVWFSAYLSQYAWAYVGL